MVCAIVVTVLVITLSPTSSTNEPEQSSLRGPPPPLSQPQPNPPLPQTPPVIEMEVAPPLEEEHHPPAPQELRTRRRTSRLMHGISALHPTPEHVEHTFLEDDLISLASSHPITASDGTRATSFTPDPCPSHLLAAYHNPSQGKWLALCAWSTPADQHSCPLVPMAPGADMPLLRHMYAHLVAVDELEGHAVSVAVWHEQLGWEEHEGQVWSRAGEEDTVQVACMYPPLGMLPVPLSPHIAVVTTAGGDQSLLPPSAIKSSQEGDAMAVTVPRSATRVAVYAAPQDLLDKVDDQTLIEVHTVSGALQKLWESSVPLPTLPADMDGDDRVPSLHMGFSHTQLTWGTVQVHATQVTMIGMDSSPASKSQHAVWLLGPDGTREERVAVDGKGEGRLAVKLPFTVEAIALEWEDRSRGDPMHMEHAMVRRNELWVECAEDTVASWLKL